MEIIHDDHSTCDPSKDAVTTIIVHVECAPGQAVNVMDALRAVSKEAGVYRVGIEQKEGSVMANSRFNSQVGQVKKTSAEYAGPKRGSDSVPSLNMSGPSWPALPGKSGPDRSAGFPEEKVYAQAKGLAGGADGDDAGATKDF
jgi:hypothetical protein